MHSPDCPTDKGVDGLLGRAGHKQNAGTTEKISDGIRSAFKKVSPALGANVLGADDR